MTLLEVTAVICYVGLVVAGAGAVLRLLRGPSVPDRIVALDTLLFVVVIGIAVDVATTEGSAFLGVLLAVALLSFVGTTTVARFVERRGGA